MQDEHTTNPWACYKTSKRNHTQQNERVWQTMRLQPAATRLGLGQTHNGIATTPQFSVAMLKSCSHSRRQRWMALLLVPAHTSSTSCVHASACTDMDRQLRAALCHTRCTHVLPLRSIHQYRPVLTRGSTQTLLCRLSAFLHTARIPTPPLV